jgi:hypothetical protein
MNAHPPSLPTFNQFLSNPPQALTQQVIKSEHTKPETTFHRANNFESAGSLVFDDTTISEKDFEILCKKIQIDFKAKVLLIDGKITCQYTDLDYDIRKPQISIIKRQGVNDISYKFGEEDKSKGIQMLLEINKRIKNGYYNKIKLPPINPEFDPTLETDNHPLF